MSVCAICMALNADEGDVRGTLDRRDQLRRALGARMHETTLEAAERVAKERDEATAAKAAMHRRAQRAESALIQSADPVDRLRQQIWWWQKRALDWKDLCRSLVRARK